MKYNPRTPEELKNDDKISPLIRTLEQLRHEGYTARDVEKRIPGTFITVDLWHADVIAMKPGFPFLLVQFTVGRSNGLARFEKCRVSPEVQMWIACGGAFQVWYWDKKGPRGNRKTWGVYKMAITSIGSMMQV